MSVVVHKALSIPECRLKARALPGSATGTLSYLSAVSGYFVHRGLSRNGQCALVGRHGGESRTSTMMNTIQILWICIIRSARVRELGTPGIVHQIQCVRPPARQSTHNRQASRTSSKPKRFLASCVPACRARAARRGRSTNHAPARRDPVDELLEVEQKGAWGLCRKQASTARLCEAPRMSWRAVHSGSGWHCGCTVSWGALAVPCPIRNAPARHSSGVLASRWAEQVLYCGAPGSAALGGPGAGAGPRCQIRRLSIAGRAQSVFLRRQPAAAARATRCSVLALEEACLHTVAGGAQILHCRG